MHRRGPELLAMVTAEAVKLTSPAGQPSAEVAFVESLTARGWLSAIWPYLWRRRRSGSARECWYFEGSWLGRALAEATGWVTGTRARRLDFQLKDVRDRDGLLVRLRIACQDLAELQAQVVSDPIFQDALRIAPDAQRLDTYLSKALVVPSAMQRGSLWRALLVIQVSLWKLAQARGGGEGIIVFLERRVWADALAGYVRRRGVQVCWVGAPVNLRHALKRRLPAGALRFIQQLRGRKRMPAMRDVASHHHVECRARDRSDGPKLGVEYYGHLNLTQPERYSDLFFWQQSSLPGRDVVVLFGIPNDPLDARKQSALDEQGMRGVAVELVGGLSGVADHTKRQPQAGAGRRWTREQAWLSDHLAQYASQRAYWTRIFEQERIRVFVSWFKYDGRHCVMADALEQLDGVTAIYQRAYEAHPGPETAIAADVVFGFAPSAADVERRAGSRIAYHVTTGYLGDHRPALVRAQARQIRERLLGRGARRVLAYTDENSHDEARWSLGHAATRENYAFLCERLLQEPWLGLLIKPKVPSTLRRRLGPVAALLERALQTGRCLVYDEGEALHSAHPPAAAALAADVMVHGHLYAATAGFEAASAGVPSLLLDREGWSISPLYRLGVGGVVFNDWETLWKACLDHWETPQGSPDFGDWSRMLDELDPFRDGRAAQRMGAYLQWLLDGLKAGLPRETVMADAAQRYAEAWGSDKVTPVNVDSRVGEPASG